MTASYDINEADNVSKVRGLIGDTDLTAVRFADETITARFTLNGSNIYLAAASCLQSLLNAIIASPNKLRFADYEQTQNDPKLLQQLIDQLRAQSGLWGNWERYETSDWQLPRWPQDTGAGFGPSGGNY